MKDKDALFSKVFGIIGERTPLKGHDCGVLCEAACCRGGDNDGMLLFPGETTPFSTVSADGGRLAVCPGSCERSERPLSCRIFPFFPAIDERGRVRVRIDSRAMGVCPLAQYSDNVRFDRRFIASLRRAGKLLAADEECRDFMLRITEEIEALDKFY